MAVATAFVLNRKKKGSGSGLSDALKLAVKNLQIMEARADRDEGGSIVDPFTLDKVIEGYKALLPMAEDEDDRASIELKIAQNESQRSSISRRATTNEIYDAIRNDSKEIRYRFMNRYANNPLGYLRSVGESFSALQDIVQSYADELENQGRISEAAALQREFSKPEEEVGIVQEISDLYQRGENGEYQLRADAIDEAGHMAQDALSNYAVVYKTDSLGRVIDMGVRRATGQTLEKGFWDEISTGSLVPIIGRDGQPMRMNGIPVYINRQKLGARNVFRLGGLEGEVVTQSTDVGEDMPTEAGLEPTMTNVGIFREQDPNLDDFNWRQTLRPMVDSLSNVSPGAYAITAGNRVFRRDLEGKWNEIDKEALPLFGDYDEGQAIKVDALSADQLRNNAGRYITKQHLLGGYNPFTGVNSLPYIPNKGESFTSIAPPQTEFIGPRQTGVQPAVETPPAAAAEQQQPTAPQQTGVPRRQPEWASLLEPSGSERFNQKTRNLFGGLPAG